MIPKIKLDELENNFFQLKGATSQTVNIMFVDFQYSNNIQPATSSNTTYPTVIGPSIYQKTANLKPLVFEDFQNLTVKDIMNQIQKDIFEKIAELGKHHREYTAIKNFDINIREMKKALDTDTERNNSIIARKIIAKINHVSNYIAIEGRIGPAQFLISNNKTYQYILQYLDDISFLFNDKNELTIGNIVYHIDNSLEDDYIFVGRKNSIDQPGVHCIIEVDNQGFIKFDEFEFFEVGNYNKNKNLMMHYSIVDCGLHPYYQYYAMNTRDISYYRNLKLQRIKELYGNQ